MCFFFFFQYACLCICAEICTLFVLLFLFPSPTLLPLSIPPSRNVASADPAPLFLSVCYLQLSCHISPLPATFLVISEGVTYLCPERQRRASACLSSCKNRQAGDQSKQTAVQESNRKLACLSTLAATYVSR